MLSNQSKAQKAKFNLKIKVRIQAPLVIRRLTICGTRKQGKTANNMIKIKVIASNVGFGIPGS